MQLGPCLVCWLREQPSFQGVLIEGFHSNTQSSYDLDFFFFFFYLGSHLASSADRKWQRCVAESAEHSLWSDRLVTWHCGEAPPPRWPPGIQTEWLPSLPRETWQRLAEVSNPPGASWHTGTGPLDLLQGLNTEGGNCNTGERNNDMQDGDDFLIWRPLPIPNIVALVTSPVAIYFFAVIR